MGGRRWSGRCAVSLVGSVAFAVASSWALAAPAAMAILPPQPAGCGFTLSSSVTTNGAAGTLGLSIATAPAVASQQCSTTVDATSTIATTSGVAATGVTNNPLSQTLTLTFAPNRLPQPIVVEWTGYCTSAGGPAELITHAGGQQSVAPLGVQEPCSEKGIFPSTLEATAVTPASVVGIATAPGDTGYRGVATDGVIGQEGTPTITVPNPATSQVWPSGIGPAVAIAATPAGNGDWVASGDGDVIDYGTAANHGSAGALHLNAPIVGMAADPATGGYWLVAADGGVFSFDAPFLGSAGGQHLNAPVVGIAAAPDGSGYWLVAADGGVFSYGGAHFSGSAGSIPLNSPVVGMGADPAGGYWLVAADGGVFSFGAPFHGSAGSVHLNAGVSGMAVTSDGGGYWLVAADGGVFSYGDAHFFGAPLAGASS